MKTIFKILLSVILISSAFSTANADADNVREETYFRAVTALVSLNAVERAVESEDHELACLNIGMLTSAIYSLDRISGQFFRPKKQNMSFLWTRPKLLGDYCSKNKSTYRDKAALLEVLVGPSTEPGVLPIETQLNQIRHATSLVGY